MATAIRAVATMDWAGVCGSAGTAGATDLDCESDYQLAIEDAASLAKYDVVVFVDADAKGPAPFWFDRVQPSRELSFSSHSASPGQWWAWRVRCSGRR